MHAGCVYVGYICDKESSTYTLGKSLQDLTSSPSTGLVRALAWLSNKSSQADRTRGKKGLSGKNETKSSPKHLGQDGLRLDARKSYSRSSESLYALPE